MITMPSPTSADIAVASELLGHQPIDVRNIVGLLMSYEEGTLGQDAMLILFSHLLRTGQVWTMQGMYGRAAMALIEAGAIQRDGTILYPLGLGE